MKVVIGLSGGMDSATLLGLLLDKGAEIHCCMFYYGSKHGLYEREAAEKLIEFYQSKKYLIYTYYFDLTSIFKGLNSSLLNPAKSIPEGNYTAENMKSTVVPGRNFIFASIMAGLAESIGAEKIALGVHAGDHFIYPDCRNEFIKALDIAIYLSSDRKVEIITPLINETKKSILEIGIKLNIPYYLTRTCYKDQLISCGKCGSCHERLEAFSLLNLKDPINYE